jgi:hypothetical protein
MVDWRCCDPHVNPIGQRGHAAGDSGAIAACLANDRPGNGPDRCDALYDLALAMDYVVGPIRCHRRAAVAPAGLPDEIGQGCVRDYTGACVPAGA